MRVDFGVCDNGGDVSGGCGEVSCVLCSFLVLFFLFDLLLVHLRTCMNSVVPLIYVCLLLLFSVCLCLSVCLFSFATERVI